MDSVERDPRFRDTRIHGLVLNENDPAPTLRELLRQWAESGQDGSPDLLARTEMVLGIVGPDGTVTKAAE